MAQVNGDSHTPTTTDNAAIAASDISVYKRKRDDSYSAQSHLPDPSQSRTKQIQKDILEVLERHDSEPSFLKHAFKNEPSPKKARLSEPANATETIAAKLSATSYASLQEIRADAVLVAEELVDTIRNKAKEKEGGRPSMDDLKHIRRVQMIESLVKDVVDKEGQYPAGEAIKAAKLDKEESAGSNGVASKPHPPLKPSTVLTLFGNAPTPKQLFSSMQKAGLAGSVIKSELPVEEMSLPNGITATKVMPVPIDEGKGLTFEETFAPPYSLLPLQPPKAHKRSSTRDKEITWEFKDPIQRNRKGGYTVQPLTVGSWLDYGGSDSTDAAATREKRKERNRALSASGEDAECPNKAILEEALAKEEEALFRRAYSSFTPTCDNSNSVVPTEIRSLVWWHKIGNRRYNDTFAIDPALLDESEHPRLHGLPTEEQFKDDAFDKVIEDLDELENVEAEPETTMSKTDIDQVLCQVSELVETLASHQRIRNATLATSGSVSRTPASPSPIVASKTGRPDEPSEDEISTYQSLQRELAYLILKLPPYAVAKINGDQLDELGVSRLITFQAKDTKGIMEEDTVTRQAKLAAMATVSSIASLARPNSSAGQHYSTTANRTPAIGQAANTRYGQQYGARTPVTAPSFQRQTSSQSYGTPTATVTRPSYGQPNQWARTGATQSSYGQQSAHQYYQRSQQTQGGLAGFNQYQQQRYQTQAQQYQPQRTVSQTAAANAASYQANTSQQPLTRTASPAKGFPPVSMASTPQHRPLYQAPSQQQQPGSGRNTPVGYPSQPHTPVNGFQPPHRPPQGIAPRPASSTPQPPSTQGSAPVQLNGTT